jgi:hypothetical protein
MPAAHCTRIPWSSSLHQTPIKKGTTEPCTSEKQPLHTLSRAPEHPHLPQALDLHPFILAQTRWYASKYSGYVRSLVQQGMITEDRNGKGKRGEWEICQQVNRSKLLREFSNPGNLHSFTNENNWILDRKITGIIFIRNRWIADSANYK